MLLKLAKTFMNLSGRLFQMRGRPRRSVIRQNMVDMLAQLGSAHGYALWREYCKQYPKVSQRSIYYHLQRGLETGEFRIASVKEEEGDYTWGASAKRTYFALGVRAEPMPLPFSKQQGKRAKSSAEEVQAGASEGRSAAASGRQRVRSDGDAP